MPHDNIQPEERAAIQHLPCPAVQRTIKACQENLKIHDEHLAADRIFLVEQLKLLIEGSEGIRAILDEKEMGYLRENHIRLGTLLKIKILSSHY